jgi:hypothetical protein
MAETTESDPFFPALRGIELEVERLIVSGAARITDPHVNPPVLFLETPRTRKLARKRFRKSFPRSATSWFGAGGFDTPGLLGNLRY